MILPAPPSAPPSGPSAAAVLVGVDAGATKTVARAITAPRGEHVGRAEGDGANPKRHGLDVAADRIAAMATAAVGAREHAAHPDPAPASTPAPAPAQAPAPASAPAQAPGSALAPGSASAQAHAPSLVYVAGAGIDRPEHARALEAALAGRLPGTRILVVNDTLAVLRAATPDGVGLVVPVSTGGNVIGRAADGRVTDRGHGVFGGGYVLGALAARAARRQADAQPATASIGRVSPELAGQVDAAGLGWQGRRPGPEAASLGAAVVAAAIAGDPYPERMVARWCARVAAAVREESGRLGLGPDPVVILYGGLLDASPWLAGRLRDAVLRGAPGARVRGLDGEPVDGAVLLALDAWSGRPVHWEFIPRR